MDKIARPHFLKTKNKRRKPLFLPFTAPFLASVYTHLLQSCLCSLLLTLLLCWALTPAPVRPQPLMAPACPVAVTSPEAQQHGTQRRVPPSCPPWASRALSSFPPAFQAMRPPPLSRPLISPVSQCGGAPRPCPGLYSGCQFPRADTTPRLKTVALPPYQTSLLNSRLLRTPLPCTAARCGMSTLADLQWPASTAAQRPLQ